MTAQEKQLRECKPDKKADGSYSLQCCQMKELLMTLHKHLLAYCFMTSSNNEPVNFQLHLQLASSSCLHEHCIMPIFHLFHTVI